MANRSCVSPIGESLMVDDSVLQQLQEETFVVSASGKGLPRRQGFAKEQCHPAANPYTRRPRPEGRGQPVTDGSLA